MGIASLIFVKVCIDPNNNIKTRAILHWALINVGMFISVMLCLNRLQLSNYSILFLR